MNSPEEGTPQGQEEQPFELYMVPGYLKDYLLDVIDLKKGVDAHATIKDIKNKRSLAGANAWMLMCSIVIASIGLSQNSQAIIIGAMLISPLMSPILGIGLSVGINDMETLKASMAHFGIAIFIAILTSYIYFELIPYDELTTEISARTKPTFLDVFVAMFGGFAGIISIARKDISTTLPGVAIATALMPPLCVTGYGLANNHWEIATASFYLFFLNTFFVALSTYVIVRFLKFPYRQYVDKRTRLINIFKISVFAMAIVIPSFLIFRNVLIETRLKRNLQNFIHNCLKDDGIYLDSYVPNTDSIGHNVLYLKVYGNIITNERKEEYLECLSQQGVKDYDLKIISTSDVNLNDVQILEQSLVKITDQLDRNRKEQSTNAKLIDYYSKAHLDSVTFDQIKDELIVLYPQIAELGLANVHLTDFDKVVHDQPTILIRWDGLRTQQIEENNNRIEHFVKTRLRIDSLKLISY